MRDVKKAKTFFSSRSLSGTLKVRPSNCSPVLWDVFTLTDLSLWQFNEVSSRFLLLVVFLLQWAMLSPSKSLVCAMYSITIAERILHSLLLGFPFLGRLLYLSMLNFAIKSPNRFSSSDCSLSLSIAVLFIVVVPFFESTSIAHENQIDKATQKIGQLTRSIEILSFIYNYHKIAYRIALCQPSPHLSSDIIYHLSSILHLLSTIIYHAIYHTSRVIRHLFAVCIENLKWRCRIAQFISIDVLFDSNSLTLKYYTIIEYIEYWLVDGTQTL